jgi:hypothetical protein
VVISYRLWNREYAASPSAVGQSIRIHGQTYTIVGVAPRVFTGMVPLLAPEVWTPMAYVDEVEPGGIISTVPSPTGNTRLERRGMRWMFVKGRLKTDATFDQAAANLRLIGKQLQTANLQTNKDREVSTLPTNDVHIHPLADRTLLPIAFGLMFVVGLVLLIACANVASMLLARASGRQKEIGIRLAIGASRRRLVQQLLSESLVLAALGAAAGTALAWTLTQAAMSITLPIPIPLSFALRIDGRVLAFTAGVALVAALVAGLAPALKATRPSLVAELKTAKEDGAKAPEKIRQEIRARMNLEASAAKILGKSEKFVVDPTPVPRNADVVVKTQLIPADGDSHDLSRVELQTKTLETDNELNGQDHSGKNGNEVGERGGFDSHLLELNHGIFEIEGFS